MATRLGASGTIPAPPPWTDVTTSTYPESVRRLFRVLGTLLLVLGLLSFSWAFVTWQWGDPVTSLYTRWKQRDLASAYERVADRFAVPPAAVRADGNASEAIRAAARRLRAAAGEGQAIGRLEVPKLGVDMVVVNGTDTASLKTGPGRDPRTFMPGEGGLVYIAGHRTTYGAPFAHIDRLQEGDRVVLRMPYATVVYRVTRYVIVPADDIGRLKSNGRELVALQACHPRFSAKERYIVYATPVSITPVQRSKERPVSS